MRCLDVESNGGIWRQLAAVYNGGRCRMVMEKVISNRDLYKWELAD